MISSKREKPFPVSLDHPGEIVLAANKFAKLVAPASEPVWAKLSVQELAEVKHTFLKYFPTNTTFAPAGGCRIVDEMGRNSCRSGNNYLKFIQVVLTACWCSLEE